MDPTQFGFRNELGTREALTAVQVLVQNCLEHQKDVYACFIDFEKAFDTVNHEQLIEAIERTDVDSKDMRMIRNLYWNQTAHVKIGQSATKDLNILKGVRQGCILSPSLFNLYSERIFVEALDGVEMGIKCNGRYINNIRYADDTVILANSMDELKQLLDLLNNKVKHYNLKMNIDKTKLMVISKSTLPTNNLLIDGQRIGRVPKYRYLGCWLNENWNPEQEIRIRIEIARSTFIKMQKLYTNKDINLKLRWRLVKCYVLSILYYGVETWTLNKLMENKIEAFEMWLYRRMLRVSWNEKVTNVDILKRMKKKKEVLATVKRRKIAYFGHLNRHDKYDLLKVIIEGKIEGKRGRGRRKMNWLDNIKKWTDIKDAVTLARLAKNRIDFAKVVTDAR